MEHADRGGKLFVNAALGRFRQDQKQRRRLANRLMARLSEKSGGPVGAGVEGRGMVFGKALVAAASRIAS